jgi:hypothetical protein
MARKPGKAGVRARTRTRAGRRAAVLWEAEATVRSRAAQQGRAAPPPVRLAGAAADPFWGRVPAGHCAAFRGKPRLDPPGVGKAPPEGRVQPEVGRVQPDPRAVGRVQPDPRAVGRVQPEERVQPDPLVDGRDPPAERVQPEDGRDPPGPAADGRGRREGRGRPERAVGKAGRAPRAPAVRVCLKVAVAAHWAPRARVARVVLAAVVGPPVAAAVERRRNVTRVNAEARS